jgi:hypothetical protein
MSGLNVKIVMIGIIGIIGVVVIIYFITKDSLSGAFYEEVKISIKSIDKLTNVLTNVTHEKAE